MKTTTSQKLLTGFLLATAALNLAWEHQTLLIHMVEVKDYYHFAAREPFIYRILPALLYRALMLGRGDWLTRINAPFDASYSIFQLAVDSVSLVLTYLFMQQIVRLLNPRLGAATTGAFVAVSALLIVVFGFFMVPNRALFYPYDFPDLCCAALIFWLSIRLRGRWEYLLPLGIFVATFNKETALFYSGLYLAFRAEPQADWTRTASVLLLCAVASVAARSAVVSLVHHVAVSAPLHGAQYEFHLAYTLEQLRNPLFVFAMLNICSYFYIAVWALRKRLDRTDLLILGMVATWIAIMSVMGIVRELRIFAPASLLMFVIVARHLTAVIEALAPAAAHPARPDSTPPFALPLRPRLAAFSRHLRRGGPSHAAVRD